MIFSKYLIWTTFILVFFGLVMIFSAGIFVSQKNFGTNYYYFNHQFLYGFLPGLLLFLGALRIDYKVWKKLSLLLILLSIGLLVLIFVPNFGIVTSGAKRWLNFFDLFSFQPSEILKLILIVYLASWLKQLDRAGKVAAFLTILFLIGFLVAAQPDIGTLGIIVGIALIMFFVSGGGMKHFLSIILLIAIGFTLLIVFEPYRFNRLFTFINPDFDVKGISYHLNQSLIAIGKGGILGLGFGKGEQKLGLLPEPAGDSIFGVIGEELGFVGTTFTIALFLLFTVTAFDIAKKAKDKFVSLYAVGLGSWVGIQAFINIASLTGLIPLTGVPLPFVSYGGTSLAVLMAGTGILVNMSKKQGL